jgi:hypothetical protein
VIARHLKGDRRFRVELELVEAREYDAPSDQPAPRIITPSHGHWYFVNGNPLGRRLDPLRARSGERPSHLALVGVLCGATRCSLPAAVDALRYDLLGDDGQPPPRATRPLPQ